MIQKEINARLSPVSPGFPRMGRSFVPLLLLAVLPGMARRNLSEVAHLTPARWAASRN
jgi:hypothetical protein